MSTLVAMVTFGNYRFSRLTIESIKRTTKNPVDFFVIVGKPGDIETVEWLTSEGIPFILHAENWGFPKSINDIYDYAWKMNNYDNLVIVGNDVIAYPHSIDSLINLATISDYEVISATQYDVRDLIREFPSVSRYFSNDKCIINDFSQEPWNNFTNYSERLDIKHMQLLDIQNMCLYKRNVFDSVGYTDVAFFPAYYIDNDYANRIVKANIKCCSLGNARFFHFWSRTIHQGNGGSTSKYFENNRMYYVTKWGGEPGNETATPTVKVDTRDHETDTIRMWRDKGL